MSSSTTTVERLDDDEWGKARDALLDWIAQRPGWVRGRGALEYLPSKPPCIVAIAPPMRDPCEPTSIDEYELLVFPPSVTYVLDGMEDVDDYSASSWRYVVTPSAAEITGLDPAVLVQGMVASLRIGEDHPDQIRRQIEMIESWRWPDRLPQRDDPAVDGWHVGLPADYDGLATALTERGWINTESVTDGMPLACPEQEWVYPGSGEHIATMLAPSADGDGYRVWAPEKASLPLAVAGAAQLLTALDLIETWTVKHPPRWSRHAQLLLAEACSRCSQPAGQPCTPATGLGGPFAAHLERVPAEAIRAVAVSALGPRPGQRPHGHQPRRRRRR